MGRRRSIGVSREGRLEIPGSVRVRIPGSGRLSTADSGGAEAQELSRRCLPVGRLAARCLPPAIGASPKPFSIPAA